MTEIILFTVTGILLYLVSDGLLRQIERQLGRTLKNRSAVFFIIFFVLALISFQLLQTYLPKTG